MDRARICLRTAAVCAVLLGSGCGSDPLEPELNALVAARARWDRAAVSSYLFEFQRLCFCGFDVTRPIRIEVLNGSVASAVYVDNGEPVSDPIVSVPTVDDLFDEIQEAVDRNAHMLDAEYDPTLGYPTEVSIDLLEFAIDEEMAFNVNALEVLDSG